MSRADAHHTTNLSSLIRDPFVRAAFEAADRDGLAPLAVLVDSPPSGDGCALPDPRNDDGHEGRHTGALGNGGCAREGSRYRKKGHRETEKNPTNNHCGGHGGDGVLRGTYGPLPWLDRRQDRV